MSTAKPHRPIGITILAVLALLATLAALLHTLQMLHILPFFLGPVQFFTFDLIGAIIWGVMTALYAWLFRALWTMGGGMVALAGRCRGIRPERYGGRLRWGFVAASRAGILNRRA